VRLRAGLTVGVLAGRLLAQIVYEATPRDPIVMIGVIIAMSLVGIMVCLIGLVTKNAHLLRDSLRAMRVFLNPK
jgi:hypothetical protein